MRLVYKDRELVNRLSVRAMEDMARRRREVERASFVDDIVGLEASGALSDPLKAG